MSLFYIFGDKFYLKIGNENDLHKLKNNISILAKIMKFVMDFEWFCSFAIIFNHHQEIAIKIKAKYPS